jgi:phage/plasmid-associated DNA primase
MNAPANRVGTENGKSASSEAEGHVAVTPVDSLNASVDEPAPDNQVSEKTRERWRRMRESAAVEEQRQAQFKAWLDGGSDDLRDAWVSVCARAATNETQDFRLVDVVEAIRVGRITVRSRWGGTEAVDLTDLQTDVRGLYRAGVAEAKMLNKAAIKKIVEALELDVSVDNVEPVCAQPKGNEKRFVITHIIVGGKKYEAPAGYVFVKPEAHGKKRADEAKKKMPGVTFAGFFQSARNGDYFMRATGLYPLDFDVVADLTTAWEGVCADKHVVCAFISITGSGLKVCVRGPIARTATEYSEFYARIANWRAKAWDLLAEVDRATKDCSRLCFLPFDPDIYVKWSAVALTAEDLTEVEPCPKPKAARDTRKPKVSGTTKAAALPQLPTESATDLPLVISWGAVPDLSWKDLPLDTCLDAMRYIDPCCDRETWRTVCAALKNGFGEEAFPFFNEWSARGGSAYSGEDDCRKLWDGHKREGGKLINPPTILWQAKQNGWAHPGRAKVDDGEPTKKWVIMEHVCDFQCLLPPIKCVGDQWYKGENGLWLPVEKNIYEPIALKVLPFHLMSNKRATEVMATFQKQQQVPRSQLKTACIWEDEKQQAVLLNCHNGLLRVTADECKLVDCDPETHCFTGQLAAAYDSKAECCLFERVWGDAQPGEQARELLMWFFGYILFPSLQHRCCLINYGPTGTSKSTIWQCGIGSAVGEGTTKNLSLSDISSTTGYSLPGLQHALLNIGGELDADELAQSSRFKLMVGGEPFEVRSIYGRPFTLRDYIVKLVFLTNHLPRFKNGTDAELARIRFVKWDQKPAAPDPNLQYRLPAEKDGIFSQWMVPALQLIMQGALPPDDNEIIRSQFAMRNDPVGVFVEKYCRIESEASVPKKELLDGFRVFVKLNDLSERLLETNVFGKLLLERFCGQVKAGRPRDGGGGREQVYAGIRLTDEFKRECQQQTGDREY